MLGSWGEIEKRRLGKRLSIFLVYFPEVDVRNGDPRGVGDFVGGPEDGGDLIIAYADDIFDHLVEVVFQAKSVRKNWFGQFAVFYLVAVGDGGAGDDAGSQAADRIGVPEAADV